MSNIWASTVNRYTNTKEVYPVKFIVNKSTNEFTPDLLFINVVKANTSPPSIIHTLEARSFPGIALDDDNVFEFLYYLLKVQYDVAERKPNTLFHHGTTTNVTSKYRLTTYKDGHAGPYVHHKTILITDEATTTKLYSISEDMYNGIYPLSSIEKSKLTIIKCDVGFKNPTVTPFWYNDRLGLNICESIHTYRNEGYSTEQAERNCIENKVEYSAELVIALNSHKLIARQLAGLDNSCCEANLFEFLEGDCVSNKEFTTHYIGSFKYYRSGDGDVMFTFAKDPTWSLISPLITLFSMVICNQTVDKVRMQEMINELVSFEHPNTSPLDLIEFYDKYKDMIKDMVKI